jgi:hypothetical protein
MRPLWLSVSALTSQRRFSNPRDTSVLKAALLAQVIPGFVNRCFHNLPSKGGAFAAEAKEPGVTIPSRVNPGEKLLRRVGAAMAMTC